MPHTYYCVGSYYQPESLDELYEHIADQAGHPDCALLVNAQLGNDRKPIGYPRVMNALLNAAFADPDCRVAWPLGDDILPDKDCLVRTEKELLRAPEYGILSPLEYRRFGDEVKVHLHHVDRSDITDENDLADLSAIFDESAIEPAIYGGIGAIRRECWLATGPLDESGKGYGEDLDWGIRCWRAGWKVGIYCGAGFFHEPNSTFTRLVADGKVALDELRTNNMRTIERYRELFALSVEEILERLEVDRRKARP